MIELYRHSAQMLMNVYKESRFARHNRYAERMSHCGTYHGNQTWHCRVRLCPICQHADSRMWQRRFSRVEKILEHDHRDSQFFLMTITLDSCFVEKLKKQLVLMEEGWRRLYQLRPTYNIGWVRSLEVVKKKNRSFPHYHSLFVLPVKTDFPEHDWSSLCQQSFRVDEKLDVDVRKVNTRIFRYITKPATAYAKGDDVEYALTLSDQIKHHRHITAGGRIKDYLNQTNLVGHSFVQQRHAQLTYTNNRGQNEEIFPSEQLTAEQWYVLCDSICERLEKECGMSRANAISLIKAKMEECGFI